MPLSDYILLALLASGGAHLPGEVPTSVTLSANAIVQPNGGARSLLLAQEDKKDEKKGIRPATTATNQPRAGQKKAKRKGTKEGEEKKSEKQMKKSANK